MGIAWSRRAAPMRSFRAAAAKWYRKAADQGPPPAHIAQLVCAGAGVPPFMATGDFGAINCWQGSALRKDDRPLATPEAAERKLMCAND